MSIYRHFDGMCWPAPCEALDALEWALRYRTEQPPSTDLLAASVVAAYRHLIALPERERNNRIRELRKGPRTRSKEGEDGR